jgi:hypothetical protein
MVYWTADGAGGSNNVPWLASGRPHPEKPWTADGWIGEFSFAAPDRQRADKVSPYKSPVVP